MNGYDVADRVLDPYSDNSRAYLLADGCIARLEDGNTNWKTVYVEVYGPDGYYIQSRFIPFYDGDRVGDIFDYLGTARPVECVDYDIGVLLWRGMTYETAMELLRRAKSERGFRLKDHVFVED